MCGSPGCILLLHLLPLPFDFLLKYGIDLLPPLLLFLPPSKLFKDLRLQILDILLLSPFPLSLTALEVGQHMIHSTSK